MEAGWIEIVRADPDTETQTANEPSGRGRPKQAYRLTETGQHATRAEAERLAALAAAAIDALPAGRSRDSR